jgi:hypothetical protein
VADDILKQAAGHLKAGRNGEARALLAGFLQQRPDSDVGWLLMSFAVADRRRQIECVQRALSINPGSAQARQRMAHLSPPVSPPAAPAGTETPSRPVSPFSSAPQAESGGLKPTGLKQQRLPTGWQSHPKVRPAADQAPSRGIKKAPAQAAAARPSAGRQPASGLMRLAIVLAAAVALIAVPAGLYGGYTLLRGYQQQQAQVQGTARALAAIALETAGGGKSLPATWTPTITPTQTVTPSPSPTPTITSTPTPVAPDATTAALMDRIEQEVSDIRGLAILTSVPRYVISRTAVRPILEASFLASGGSREALADESRSLAALGLVKPTYDLYTNALNGLTDALGGFYFPRSHELFVIGTRFGGIEHWIFSHEFDHALTDQHFHFANMGVYPVCTLDAQHCQAIRALVEGDATLAMSQWLQQYAGPKDYQDIYNYRPPKQTLPEQFPPPYVYPDSEFPYSQGLDFVTYLYDRGRWSEVNKAYADPPQSTEQILHPEKYLAGEAPLAVAALPLDAALGSGWRQLTSDVMGEWTTFLLLAYGSDLEAELPDNVARPAAAGWGGDRYQIYYNDETGQTTVAAHWIWDTSGDQLAFRQAMLTYQDARFKGAKVMTRSDGNCWEVNEQASCIFATGRETLWLLAPNQSLVNAMLSQAPQFP